MCGLARDTIVVDSIIQALVNFNLDDTLLCVGDTLVLDATVEQGTYLWQDGSTNAVFYATAADTIWVEALNVCNITPATDTMVVRFTDIPVIPELDSVLCNGESYFIDLTTDSLSTFVWYDGNAGAFDTITLQNTYWVQEWNICGQDSTDFLVAFVSDPQTLLGNDTVLCISDSMVLDASTPFGAYVWNTGDVTGAITIDASYLSGDSNHYIVTVYNACKADTDNIIIAADYPIDVDLGNDTTLCEGEALVLQPTPAISANRVGYLWQSTPTLLDSSNTDQSISLVAGSAELPAPQVTEYTLSASNAFGTFSDWVNVFVDEALTPDLGADRVVCFGDTVTLQSSPSLDNGRTDFVWQNSAQSIDSTLNASSITFIAGGDLAPLFENTLFELIASNTCGSFSDQINVQVDSLPKNYPFERLFFCEGESTVIVIEKDDIDYLEWEDGSRSVSREINSARDWNITFVNHCGNVNQVLRSVEKLRPNISIEPVQKLCGDAITLEPIVPIQEDEYEWLREFVWSTGEVADRIDAYETGHYAVTITNQFDCTDSASVWVKTCGADWYVPNAFTPGSNRINDYWKPEGEGIYSYEVKIFDRWGKPIFSFTENDLGWDGSSAGVPAPNGTYVYQMVITSEEFPKGTEVNGSVILLR